MRFLITIISVLVYWNSSAQLDSSRYIEMDAFHVPIRFLKSEVPAHKINCDSIFSYDKVWFKNKKRNQQLVIELATDYHHLNEYVFYLDNPPAYFIQSIYLNDSLGNITTPDQNKVAYPCFSKKAKELPRRFFTSEFGMRLGVHYDVISEELGEFTALAYFEDQAVVRWFFTGDQVADMNNLHENQRLALDSYGYLVTAVFSGEILIGYSIKKEIP
jgi:hypothetical protein